MPKGWHPEDIKAAVRKTGITLSKLGEDHGLSSSACRKALVTSVPRADKIIAEHIGKPLHVIWPNRYDRDGKRTPLTNVNKSITRKARSYSQKVGRV